MLHSSSYQRKPVKVHSSCQTHTKGQVQNKWKNLLPPRKSLLLRACFHKSHTLTVWGKPAGAQKPWIYSQLPMVELFISYVRTGAHIVDESSIVRLRR